MIARAGYHEQVAFVRRLIGETAEGFGASVAEIVSHQRCPELVAARDRIIATAYRQGLTCTLIAREMNRDHSSIVASLKRSGVRR